MNHCMRGLERRPAQRQMESMRPRATALDETGEGRVPKSRGVCRGPRSWECNTWRTSWRPWQIRPRTRTAQSPAPMISNRIVIFLENARARGLAHPQRSCRTIRACGSPIPGDQSCIGASTELCKGNRGRKGERPVRVRGGRCMAFRSFAVSSMPSLPCGPPAPLPAPTSSIYTIKSEKNSPSDRPIHTSPRRD